MPNLFGAADISSLIDNEIGDEASKLAASIVEFQPEIVMHMAAQPLVRVSYCDPADTYSTNVLGTVNIFEAVDRQTA